MDYLNAFWVGGLFCVIAQLLIDKTAMTPARILVSYVVAGVILTALNIYAPIVKFASCGATVPLSGFGYSIAMGVEKAVHQYGILGALSGGISATAAGISAAITAACICALIFKGNPK